MKKKKAKSFQEERKWYRYQFFGKATVKPPKEKSTLETTVANISFSGIGLYSATTIGKGKKVKITISFVDRKGKIVEDSTTGTVDWQKKFRNMYLIGILFDQELNIDEQPRLIEHLLWLIDTFRWPQPYKEKRIVVI
jgi:hypothetical protein